MKILKNSAAFQFFWVVGSNQNFVTSPHARYLINPTSFATIHQQTHARRPGSEESETFSFKTALENLISSPQSPWFSQNPRMPLGLGTGLVAPVWLRISANKLQFNE
jgi:hypothetical protein